VVHARVHERLLDAVTIDRDRPLVCVLLDDREQVAEQSTLDRRQLGAFDRPVRGRFLNPVDLDPRGRDQRRLAAVGSLPGRGARGLPPAGTLGGSIRGLAGRAGTVIIAAAGAGAAQPLRRGFAVLLRNCRPSSCRFE
jgi:hypothetical protein